MFARSDMRPAFRRLLGVCHSALLILPVLLPYASAARAGEQVPTPKRVVSMNLCTDQLALMLAKPGQLLSVSSYSHRKRSSLLYEEAIKLPVNFSQAEDIAYMKPDVVLAGSFTSLNSVQMLKRLGIRVEQFKSSQSFADIRTNVLRMGAILGRQEQAKAMVATFDARLASLRSAYKGQKRPLLGTYEANAYVVGERSLAHAIIRAAGYRNLGKELGFSYGGKLPLESLLFHNPDYLLTWDRWSANPIKSEEVLDHPVIQKHFGAGKRISQPSKGWICGTPYVIDAIEALAAVRLRDAAPGTAQP